MVGGKMLMFTSHKLQEIKHMKNEISIIQDKVRKKGNSWPL